MRQRKTRYLIYWYYTRSSTRFNMLSWVISFRVFIVCRFRQKNVFQLLVCPDEDRHAIETLMAILLFITYVLEKPNKNLIICRDETKPFFLEGRIFEKASSIMPICEQKKNKKPFKNANWPTEVLFVPNAVSPTDVLAKSRICQLFFTTGGRLPSPIGTSLGQRRRGLFSWSVTFVNICVIFLSLPRREETISNCLNFK